MSAAGGCPRGLVMHQQAYNAAAVSRSSRSGALIPVLAGTAACAVGVLVLVGWFSDVRILRQPLISASAMMANAALGFILCGASLLLRARQLSLRSTGEMSARFLPRPLAITAAVLALLAAVIGAVSFSQDLFGWDAGIDGLLVPRPPAVGPHPGRMSWLTALCLLLVGSALTASKRRVWLAHCAALVVLFGSTIVTVGYLYDVRELVGLGKYTTTAPHSAGLFVLLALGILFLKPHDGVMAALSSDTLGGRMARRTLPATIAVPILLGWLRLEGERAQLYPANLGPPLIVFGTMVLLSIVVWLNARKLDDADARRREAEVEMRRANETLEDRVAVKTAEALQDQARAAEAAERLRAGQRMEAMGQLAGGVAHDFNNTMTVITGYTELLLARTRSDDESYKPLDEIRKAGVRCSALTRHLLAFSRRQVLTPSLMDLNVVVADLGDMLPMLIGEDIEVAIDSETALWPIRADATQIEQVIVNLVVNARDAMPAGGRITIRTRNIEITRVNAGAHPEIAPGSYVQLSVADSGRGMDEETRVRAFDPFFTTKPVGQGTGLGLSTAYGVITQSDGTIYLDSAPGQGTTVRIYLPRAFGKVTAAPSPAAEPLERGAETVLLVEDEDGLRQLLKTVLEGAGYRVLEAGNGRQALDLSRAHEGPIDILVSDVVMPGMGGRELVERITPLRPEARVLLISGYTQTAGFEHTIARAGAAFLQKPFTPDVFLTRVRDVLTTGRAAGRVH
jgi:signal transduction histidine kinase/ActR/RegA family two-component response regulator